MNYIDNLDYLVNKYNNTYHSKIKLKTVDVKSNIYIVSGKEINEKDLTFKIGDNVRISKYMLYIYICYMLNRKVMIISLIAR